MVDFVVMADCSRATETGSWRRVFVAGGSNDYLRMRAEIVPKNIFLQKFVSEINKNAKLVLCGLGCLIE